MNKHELGTWNATCAVCGGMFKAADLIRHWQGYYVCRRDYEPRHPWDYPAPIKDDSPVPWAQPIPDTPVDYVPRCTLSGSSGVPGYATPGCATPSRDLVILQG